MVRKITDYFDESNPRSFRVDYNQFYNRGSISVARYLNNNIGSHKIKNRIDILKRDLRADTRPLEYKSFNRRTDKNQILDWGSLRSRMNAFFDSMTERPVDRIREPTHDEMTRVIWEYE